MQRIHAFGETEHEDKMERIWPSLTTAHLDAVLARNWASSAFRGKSAATRLANDSVESHPCVRQR